MKRYKVLDGSLTSPFQNFKFELGKKYHCDNFDDNPALDCSYGFYATKIDGLPYSFNVNRKVYECEVSGKKVELNQYKCRYEYFELIKEIPHNIIKLRAKKAELRLGYKLSEILFPFHPFIIEPKKILEKNLIKLVKNWDSVRVSVEASVWDSVRDSVWASVWDSVRDSVWASVRASVRDSVWDSVWDSVGDSVWAYISSFFPNIKKWNYVDHKKGINPFQSAIDLWKMGYVISFDGNTYRVHAHKDARIVLTINKGYL